MRVLRDESRFLVDTGPFCRFAEAGHLTEMASYLGEQAQIVLDVRAEIRRRSRRPEHAALADLEGLGFPHGEPFELSPEQWADVDMIRRKNKQLGEHASENLGEIASVVFARDRRDAVIVLDDRAGTVFAELNSLYVCHTTDMVVEMVVAHALSEDDGWPIFESVYHQRRETYAKALATAPAA